MRGVVRIANMMDEKVTVKSVAVEIGSGPFAVPETFSVPFVLAPAETYDVPLTLSARKGRGTARVRIIATTPKLQADVAEFVKFHYEFDRR
jgi:hypothetical protein